MSWGPLHAWDWEPVTLCTSSALIGGKGGSRSKFRVTLRFGNYQSKWMHDRCKKSTWMGSYIAFCFMVAWTIFKIHLLEVGLTQTREIMALQNLTTVDLCYYIMCEDHAWIRTRWNSILVEGLVTIGLFTTLEDPWLLYMIFGSVLGHFSFGLSLVHVWSGPKALGSLHTRDWELVIITL